MKNSLGSVNYSCNYLGLIVAFVMLWLSGTSTACPSGCTCSVDQSRVEESIGNSYLNYDNAGSSEDERGLREVYCINKGLTSPLVPDTIPNDTYYL